MGTRINTGIVDVIMPPTIGAAIGFMTSEPMPVFHKIGINLTSTTQTVMSLGQVAWPSQVGNEGYYGIVNNR